MISTAVAKMGGMGLHVWNPLVNLEILYRVSSSLPKG